MAAPTASELIGSHHFYNTSCRNCELRSVSKFTDPLLSEVGPLKACGEFPCTGRENYFIEDHTGHLFNNQPGTLISKSQALASYLSNNNTNELCQ